MNRLRHRPRAGRRAPALRGAAGERGVILVMTLVILLVLSMLAGAALVNGLLVRGQARSEANAAIALHATEAGIAAGMAWLSDPANLDGYHYPSLTGDLPDPALIDEGATPGVNEAYASRTEWQDWTHTLPEKDQPPPPPFLNGGSYAVTLRFKRERLDRNGDGDCCDTYPDVPVDEDSGYRDGDANLCSACPGDVVLFNSGTGADTASGSGLFGFAGSHYSGAAGDEGYPVVEIESVGRLGSSAERQIALFVASNHKAQVEGGITSRAPVTVASAAASVDGTNFDSPLFAGTCGSDLPGIMLDVGVDLACDLNGDGDCEDAGECASTPQVGGSICSENFDPLATGKRPLPGNPWDALGMTEADFKSFFTKDTTSSVVTTPGAPCNAASPPLVNLWYANENGVKFNSSSTCADYSGILVVHNQGFFPDEWAAHCPDAASMASAYCSDPAHKPAVLEIDGRVTWNGIIVADQVMKVTGNPTIVGGVISLASGGYGVASQIQGSIEIKYSCDAVAAVSRRIGYKRKIGWQRLR